MSDFQRNEVIEKQFKKRYLRDVKVERDIEKDGDKLISATVKIHYKDKTYTIKEYFTDEQLTDYVIVNGTDKYDTHLQGEIYVVDLMSKQEE